MTGQQIFVRLETIVREQFGVAEGICINAATSSVDVAGWDSLSHSILIMQTEEAFNVSLDLELIYRLANLGELAALVEAKLRADATENAKHEDS